MPVALLAGLASLGEIVIIVGHSIEGLLMRVPVMIELLS
jgi:hypothetical protein